jgi:regulatory protein YycI of two-component signal transduction system YycFG
MLSFFSSSERNADYNQTPSIFLLFLIIGGIALWGLISYAKYRKEKKEMIEEEKHLLNQKIDEIIQQISDKELRKKSLLTAEEVIVAKDLKVVKDITTTEKFSEETLSSELEKVCPMCAETIKKAAKVCRYCGYKF